MFARGLFKGISVFLVLCNFCLADVLPNMETFLRTLQNKRYPINFLIRSSQKLTAINVHPKDKNDALSPMFRLGSNDIILPAYYFNGNVLNSLNKLSPDSIGVLYHEFWHAYFHNFLKADEDFMLWFVATAEYRFPDLSSIHAIEALEELYGNFIGDVVKHFIFLEKNLPAKTRDERSKKCKEVHIVELSEVIHDSHSAYYSNYSGKTITVASQRLEKDEIDFLLGTLLENKVLF